MPKKSRQKLKHLESEGLLRSKEKYFSLFLKGFQLQKNCFRPESAPLRFFLCFQKVWKCDYLNKWIKRIFFPELKQKGCVNEPMNFFYNPEKHLPFLKFALTKLSLILLFFSSFWNYRTVLF